ncbi:MAG: phosphomethylpyrimidine synthase ThiC, partial [Nitrospiraceae bacterium]|nr:phosphomethylpyrimidine synthase ThiC [Nitrospiraceae bacterium]
MTQLERALKGETTEEIRAVSATEEIDSEVLRERVASGKIIIPANKHRKQNVVGIGKGLRTKVNASIGTSTDIAEIAM